MPQAKDVAYFVRRRIPKGMGRQVKLGYAITMKYKGRKINPRIQDFVVVSDGGIGPRLRRISWKVLVALKDVNLDVA